MIDFLIQEIMLNLLNYEKIEKNLITEKIWFKHRIIL